MPHVNHAALERDSIVYHTLLVVSLVFLVRTVETGKFLVLHALQAPGLDQNPALAILLLASI